MSAAARAPAIVAPGLERDPKVAEIRTSIERVLVVARELAVDSEASRDTAADLLAQIRRAKRAAESRRVELVKPHNDHVSSVNAFFKGVVQPMALADATLERRILAWNAEQRRKADEAAREAERQRKESERLLREAEDAERAGKADAGELLDRAVASEESATSAQASARTPARVIPTVAGTVGERKKPWTYREVDLAKVPREYLCLEAGAVRRAINAGVREIPGLEIYQEEGLAVR